MIHVGIGYDVHQLVAGRKLILGGVEIPHARLDIDASTSLASRRRASARSCPAAAITSRNIPTPGGIHTILGSIAGRPGLLILDCPTVSGKSLGENIADFDIRAATVEEDALQLAAVTAGGRARRRGHGRAAFGGVDPRSV